MLICESIVKTNVVKNSTMTYFGLKGVQDPSRLGWPVLAKLVHQVSIMSRTNRSVSE